MDVQGSQYHLVNGLADWARCTDANSGLLLGTEWQEELVASPSVVHSALEYDPMIGALRLSRDLALFRRAGRTVPLEASTRRGAGRDGYGNWYWVNADEDAICWRPVDDNFSVEWWSPAQLRASCAGPQSAVFSSCTTPPAERFTLRGLAVTTLNYLVVGYMAEHDQGLFVFDLQAGGAPNQLFWPPPFAPFDMADTADGGVLILDRQNAAYFRLDENFRLPGHVWSPEGSFAPVGGGPPERRRGTATPVANLLYAGSPLGCVDAISIEPGPGAGTALVLESSPAQGYSIVHLFGEEGLLWSTPLADALEVISTTDPTDTPQLYSLLGHDFAYLVAPPATGPLTPPMLYIADAEGKQVVAFTVDAATGHLEPQPDFLPLREWPGKALVRWGAGAWYDFADRWVSLEVFNECIFEPVGTLTTAADFANGPPGQPFDSQVPGCVWHRLLLDAWVPSGTSVEVQARAADDPELLVQSPWLPQPTPYQRSDGAEIAWFDPWKDQRTPLPDYSLPPGMGTWELLFQQVTGRYVQIALTLWAVRPAAQTLGASQSTGHSSPAIRSLRAWYPRFSYPANYLPAVYSQDAAPRCFLERWLANFEGFYTVTEERIEHSSLVFDARTTPLDDLAWLACWFGLILDPVWNERQQRFMISNVDHFYRCRGTPGGLLAILQVYFNPDVDSSIFDGGGSGAGGLRIVERFLARPPSAVPDPGAVAAAAHRFDVLVPAGLGADDLAMVERIVAFNQPAHTATDFRTYYDLFVVGQARLGLDTQLGNTPSFSPMVVGGQGALAATYLGFPYPFQIPDRIVVDRDRVGGLSPL